MAVNKKIRVIKGYGETVKFQTAARDGGGYNMTAAIAPGEPLQSEAVGSEYVAPCITAGPVVGSDEMVGIARKASTETTSAAGTVEVITVLPGTILRGYASTSTNVDTTSKLNALIGEWCYFDVTAVSGTNGHFTFDENEAQTEPNKGSFKILDGDITKYTLDCAVHSGVTMFTNLQGQTMD